MNIDLVVTDPRGLLEPSAITEVPRTGLWHSAAFLTIWELQSHLASMAFIALVAFSTIWVALAAMLTWSLIATVVFCRARERGYPNILTDDSEIERKPSMNLARYAAGSVFRAFLAGFNAFIFARCSSFLLTTREGCGRVRSVAKYAVLGVGLTLFGVTTAEHILRKAGYSGAKLTRLGLIGPFLNVPYRIMLSAAVVALLRDSLVFI